MCRRTQTERRWRAKDTAPHKQQDIEAAEQVLKQLSLVLSVWGDARMTTSLCVCAFTTSHASDILPSCQTFHYIRCPDWAISSSRVLVGPVTQRKLFLKSQSKVGTLKKKWVTPIF